MKSVLYISTYLDPITLRYVNIKSGKDVKPSIAAIKYADLIKKGLIKQSDIALSNLYLPTLAPYPDTKIKCFKRGRTENGSYIPFLNFFFIKQISIVFFLFIYTLKWILSVGINRRKYIVLSSIQLPFLIALFLLKLLNVKIISFVPDLPQYQFSYTQERSRLKKMFIPLYLLFSKLLFCIIDSYVFISHHMKSFFPNKPFVVMEGIVDENEDLSLIVEKTEKFTVMYAGALYEKFGLKSLLEAFINIKDERCELWLFGNGDMVDFIKELSQRDLRIIYWGNKPNRDIVSFEMQATLLVNPRFSSYEFTKYSFPSKLLEYMSSGTPVLTTKLPCIPEEYLDKMLYFKEETPEGFRKSIEDCMLMDRAELNAFGARTKKYVVFHKNSVVQLMKIKDFIFA